MLDYVIVSLHGTDCPVFVRRRACRVVQNDVVLNND